MSDLVHRHTSKMKKLVHSDDMWYVMCYAIWYLTFFSLCVLFAADEHFAEWFEVGVLFVYVVFGHALYHVFRKREDDNDQR